MREQEVVTYLADDTDLATLVPGGIYAAAVLSVEGLTDAAAMPDVWAGGTFQTSIIVRERASVPAFGLVDLKDQAASQSQAIEIWMYSREISEIEDVRQAVYGLMQGYKLVNSWRAEWSGGLSTMDAPELPPSTKVGRDDYRVVSIRQPTYA